MAVSERPLVSVVNPEHNGETFLAECIENVLAQSYCRCEYTIVKQLQYLPSNGGAVRPEIVRPSVSLATTSHL
jgi:hypothetical protein